MNAHTYGPHHVGGGKFKNERPLGDEHFAIFNRSCACLAHVFNEGDAHLYAAAPDLLAACEAASYRLEREYRRQCESGDGVDPALTADCETLRAAIAAARGDK